MSAIFMVVRELGTSLLAAVFTKAFLRPLIIKALKGEAKAYQIRASKTPGKEDDIRAQVMVDVANQLEETWKS